jgi:hypothetical protein
MGGVGSFFLNAALVGATIFAAERREYAFASTIGP